MSSVGVSVDDAGVAVVTIDHPPINLMTVEVFLELAATVDRLAVDDDVRAVVLRSADPEWFIAHFDVAAILGFPTDQPPPSGLNGFHVMCEQLRTMPKPTIAQISGRVGGGGSEVALSCDMRFVTPDSVRYAIHDLFATVTLWDFRTVAAAAVKRADGRYEVTVRAAARKYRSDGLGVEREIPIADLVDVGVFGKTGAGELGIDLAHKTHGLTGVGATERALPDHSRPLERRRGRRQVAARPQDLGPPQ